MCAARQSLQCCWVLVTITRRLPYLLQLHTAHCFVYHILFVIISIIFQCTANPLMTIQSIFGCLFPFIVYSLVNKGGSTYLPRLDLLFCSENHLCQCVFQNPKTLFRKKKFMLDEMFQQREFQFFSCFWNTKIHVVFFLTTLFLT